MTPPAKGVRQVSGHALCCALSGISMMMRLFFALVAALGLVVAVPARADVTVTFWSHTRDQNYPHAFILMRGRVDATGEVVDSNIGFTARRLSPGLLFGSVDGQMETLSAGYVARATSAPHFSVRLDDAGYARLTAAIARWRAAPQPGYNLNRRNCVHFVMEMAAVLGLSVNRQTAHVRSPRDFMLELMRLNPTVTPARR